jgi:DNA-binding NarL/FixJ family response regulator
MSDKIIRVSIVEDTDDIREAMRVLINGSQGFECLHVFPDAETALQGLPSKDVDVVLMDINLPGINGIECMALLKDRMPKTQFMMCTVYDDDENIFSALESGANGYMLKRTSPAQILEAIRDLHEGGSPMSSEIARRVVDAMQRKKKPAGPVEILTEREKEILDFLSRGFLYKEIANELFISKETVKKHIHNIYDKLHVQTRTEALNKAYQR